MYDLNATMFYKAKFRVALLEHGNNCNDLLWKIVLEIRSWLLGKWNGNNQITIDRNLVTWTRFKSGGKLYDVNNTNRIYAESMYYSSNKNPSAASWACKIIEKPEATPGVAPREWVTEIGVQLESDDAAILTYVVTYSDLAGYIGVSENAPETISVPRVIRRLLNDPKLKCTVGNSVITDRPYKLGPGDYPEFERVIFDKDREIPIIYISPKRVSIESDESIIPVSATKMADSVAANALVYYSTALDFSSEMRYLGDEKYTCYNGAIRVYAPHINPDHEGDQYRHKILSYKFIEGIGEEATLRIFRRALAQDVHYYESMLRIENCRAQKESDAHDERIRKIKKKSECDVDEAYAQFLAESELREETERNLQIYMERLDEVKAENYSLHNQIEMLMVKAKRCEVAEKSNRIIREVSEYPNTPEKIARYFVSVYSDRLVFSDRGIRSLESCKMKNELLWEVLYHMATDLYVLLHSYPTLAYKEFTERKGWVCARGEGKETRKNKKQMRQYFDEYNGQEISIESHIKNGVRESDPKFIRIYFAYDPAVDDRIIIGHCGDHLENYSTRKVS